MGRGRRDLRRSWTGGSADDAARTSRNEKGRFIALCGPANVTGWGSEGPASGAAGLLGHHGVGVFGGELVDIPGRRAGARGTVVVGEPAVGDRRRPAALC